MAKRMSEILSYRLHRPELHPDRGSSKKYCA